MDLRNAVSTAFGVEAPTTLAFDYPTAAALAVFVADRVASAAASDVRREPPVRHGSFGHQIWPAASAGVGSSSSDSAPSQDPALGPAIVGRDPQRLAEEVSAVVAEVLGRPVAADVPLMEV